MTKRTQLIVRIALFTGTAISLFFVPWILIKAWILPLPHTVEEQLDEALGHGFDGMIVYVDKAGIPPAYYAAGWHNREKKIPADPDALFKIASISKLYDAVSIAKLVHNGLLSLDGTLGEYFPELVGRIEYADKITIQMMVEHRSGIPNLTDTPNFWNDPPQSSQEALELVLDLPADFKPGEKYAYCNTNYLLLSELITKVSSMDRFTFMQKEILEPLGLKNTFGSIHDVDMDRVMSGYYVGIEEDIKGTDYGSMLATAEDVGIFLRALNDGSVFEQGEKEIYSSIYKYKHSGLIPGYQSMAKYHEKMDAVIIQFVNTTDFRGYEWNLSQISYKRVAKIVGREAYR